MDLIWDRVWLLGHIHKLTGYQPNSRRPRIHSRYSSLIAKQAKYQGEIDKISSRLSNKDFVKRAPKHIVHQEKSNYNNLQNDVKKLSLTIKNL